MSADVFTDKDRKIIKILLERPWVKIYKYHFSKTTAWELSSAEVPLAGGARGYQSFTVGDTLNKLEKLGFIKSDISDKEFKIQFALGITKAHMYYVPEKSLEILKKLFEGELLCP